MNRPKLWIMHLSIIASAKGDMKTSLRLTKPKVLNTFMLEFLKNIPLLLTNTVVIVLSITCVKPRSHARVRAGNTGNPLHARGRG